MLQLPHDRRAGVGKIEDRADPEPLVGLAVRRGRLPVGEEPQVILGAEFLVVGLVDEVEIEALDGERIRAVPPRVLLLLREAAVQRDVQRGEPLLPIEHRRRATPRGNSRLARVGVIALVVVRQKLIERVRLRRLGLDVPEQEGPDGVPTHEAVDELGDLVGAPDELALDRRHQVLALVDSGQHLLDAARGLERHTV